MGRNERMWFNVLCHINKDMYVVGSVVWRQEAHLHRSSVICNYH